MSATLSPTAPAVTPSRGYTWKTRDPREAILSGEAAFVRFTIVTTYSGRVKREVATYAVEAVREDGLLRCWRMHKLATARTRSETHFVDFSFGGEPSQAAACDCDGHKYRKAGGKSCRHCAFILKSLPALGIDPVTGEAMEGGAA